MTTIDNLTREQIESLQAEAQAAGDLAMSVICDIAIRGTMDAGDFVRLTKEGVAATRRMDRTKAMRVVVKAINDAKAQEVGE